MTDEQKQEFERNMRIGKSALDALYGHDTSAIYDYFTTKSGWKPLETEKEKPKPKHGWILP